MLILGYIIAVHHSLLFIFGKLSTPLTENLTVLEEYRDVVVKEEFLDKLRSYYDPIWQHLVALNRDLKIDDGGPRERRPEVIETCLSAVRMRAFKIAAVLVPSKTRDLEFDVHGRTCQIRWKLLRKIKQKCKYTIKDGWGGLSCVSACTVKIQC